jgi:hypothetical protein
MTSYLAFKRLETSAPHLIQASCICCAYLNLLYRRAVGEALFFLEMWFKHLSAMLSGNRAPRNLL